MLSATYLSAQWTQLGLDLDGDSSGSYFGSSVSMNYSGTRLASGAPQHNGNGVASGLVRVFDWNGLTWSQLGSGLNGENPFDQSGIAVSMDSLGRRVAIGSRLNNGNGTNSGHTRVYDWNGSVWLQLGADIDGGAIGDESGGAICLNGAGNRVAIGAEGNDGNGTNSGHVRVFDWNGTTWTQVGADVDGEATSDNSGFSVSLNNSGSRLAVGAPLNDGGGNNAGQTRVYEWNGTAWVQMGTDIDGENAGDESGHSVSLNTSGNRIVIGANKNAGNGFKSGHVRIFEWNGTTWTQLGSDIDGEASSDEFGYSVSISGMGNKVTVGAPFNGDGGFRSGHVQMFNWNGSAWVQIGSDIDGEASNDWSGYAVCSNKAGNKVGIGAWLNDGNGVDAGHVRVYENNYITGLEGSSKALFSIHPNPASQNIILETQNLIGEVAQITSITGKLILEFNVTKNKEKIDVSEFQNGVYFLRVGEMTKKIIVAR